MKITKETKTTLIQDIIIIPILCIIASTWVSGLIESHKEKLSVCWSEKVYDHSYNWYGNEISSIRLGYRKDGVVVWREETGTNYSTHSYVIGPKQYKSTVDYETAMRFNNQNYINMR